MAPFDIPSLSMASLLILSLPMWSLEDSPCFRAVAAQPRPKASSLFLEGSQSLSLNDKAVGFTAEQSCSSHACED